MQNGAELCEGPKILRVVPFAKFSVISATVTWRPVRHAASKGGGGGACGSVRVSVKLEPLVFAAS